MRSQLMTLAYEIELEPGDTLTLPPELTASVGTGRWLVTIQPAPAASSPPLPPRNYGDLLENNAPPYQGVYED